MHGLDNVSNVLMYSCTAVVSCLEENIFKFKNEVVYIFLFYIFWGTRWRNWLRHCATSRQVVGSIPDGVIGIFHWHNPSDRTMALGSTQPLTEMSTSSISWGVKAAGT